MSDHAAAKGSGSDPPKDGSRHASPAPQSHPDGGDGEETGDVRVSRESTPGADKNAVVQTRWVEGRRNNLKYGWIIKSR